MKIDQPQAEISAAVERPVSVRGVRVGERRGPGVTFPDKPFLPDVNGHLPATSRAAPVAGLDFYPP